MGELVESDSRTEVRFTDLLFQVQPGTRPSRDWKPSRRIRQGRGSTPESQNSASVLGGFRTGHPVAFQPRFTNGKQQGFFPVRAANMGRCLRRRRDGTNGNEPSAGEPPKPAGGFHIVGARNLADPWNAAKARNTQTDIPFLPGSCGSACLLATHTKNIFPFLSFCHDPKTLGGFSNGQIVNCPRWARAVCLWI